MKTKVKLIIIVTVILIIFLILVTLFNSKNVLDYIFPKYIINKDGEVWQYQDDKISLVTDDDYLHETYNIYVNSKKKYKGKIMKYHYIKKDGDKGYSKQNYRLISNLDLKLADFTKEKIDVWKTNIVKNALSGVPSKFMPFFSGYGVSYDLDSDGKKETLYFVTNLIVGETNMGITSKILLKKDNTLKQVIQTSHEYKYDIVDIVDINNDNVYELIIKKQESTGKELISCNQLYRLKNDKWKLVYDCNPE